VFVPIFILSASVKGRAREAIVRGTRGGETKKKAGTEPGRDYEGCRGEKAKRVEESDAGDDTEVEKGAEDKGKTTTSAMEAKEMRWGGDLRVGGNHHL
jgi:hypothetical protein